MYGTSGPIFLGRSNRGSLTENESCNTHNWNVWQGFAGTMRNHCRLLATAVKGVVTWVATVTDLILSRTEHILELNTFHDPHATSSLLKCFFQIRLQLEHFLRPNPKATYTINLFFLLAFSPLVHKWSFLKVIHFFWFKMFWQKLPILYLKKYKKTRRLITHLLGLHAWQGTRNRSFHILLLVFLTGNGLLIYRSML